MICVAIILVALTVVYFIGRGPQNPNKLNESRRVYISNNNDRYKFVKDGRPFIVKGGAGYTNIKELGASGGNTIFCWDTTQIEHTLKEAARYNLAVIIGLDIPGGEDDNFYNNEKDVAACYERYRKLVLKYRNDTTLLAWCLGNELSMPLTLSTPPFYTVYNRLLTMMHQLDPQHPVATSVMNVPKRNLINIQWRMPALDFICINTYNRLKSINTDLNLVESFWKGPYLVGEWAPDGGWEVPVTDWEAPIENTSTKKAEQFNELYKKYMPLNDPRFLGDVVFYWGNRQEYTHTWYSIFSENNEPTEVYEVLNDWWKNTSTSHLSPQIEYMLIDSLGGADNIIVSAGTVHSAVVLANQTSHADSLCYRWEILKEDWVTWGNTWKNFKKSPVLQGLMLDNSQQEMKFTAPATEGPYRVYITVSNTKGFCATANTPIYVIQ